MTGNRKPNPFWARAEKERRALAAAFEAEASTRILNAGSISSDDLSDRTRRTLAWLAGWDSSTIDGLVELLAAAHQAGRAATHQGADGQARSARRTVTP